MCPSSTKEQKPDSRRRRRGRLGAKVARNEGETKKGGGSNEWREWGREEQSTDECTWMLSHALSWRADMQHHTHFRALYQSLLWNGTHTRWVRLSLRCSASKPFDAFLLLCHGNMLKDPQRSRRWILSFGAFVFELVTLNLRAWLILLLVAKLRFQQTTAETMWQNVVKLIQRRTQSA